MPSVSQLTIHKCTFLLCGCLHRDFTHNGMWHNSILQQSTPVCHLIQKEIVNVKNVLHADTFITTPELNILIPTFPVAYSTQNYTVITATSNLHICKSFIIFY